LDLVHGGGVRWEDSASRLTNTLRNRARLFSALSPCTPPLAPFWNRTTDAAWKS
jgi:hypothetical protein